jgi:hypothetical protein
LKKKKITAAHGPKGILGKFSFPLFHHLKNLIKNDFWLIMHLGTKIMLQVFVCSSQIMFARNPNSKFL